MLSHICSFVAGFICALPVVAVPLYYYVTSLDRPQHKSKDPTICNSILTCRGFLGPGINENKRDPAKCRAQPNQRLVRFFGIDNSFTSFNSSRVRKFKSAAREKITLEPEKWLEVSRIAKEIVRARLFHSDEAPCARDPNSNDAPLDSIWLDDLVRSLCFQITILVFFDRDPSQLDEDCVQSVADQINDLWVKSKTQDSPTGFEKRCLRSALDSMALRIDGVDIKENPLNYILPAYETLWRVVLCCFLEVAFREGADLRWSTTLEDFAQAPGYDKFKSTKPGLEGVSARSIVNEALRLYPSTKSVYRTFQTRGLFQQEDFVADIEGCHRNPEIWESPDRFVPSRWETPSPEALEAYMPFGRGRFTCPAKSQYGPWMIAILVEALTTHIKGSEFALFLYPAGGGIVNGLARDELLAAGRKSYKAIEIRRHGS